MTFDNAKLRNNSVITLTPRPNNPTDAHISQYLTYRPPNNPTHGERVERRGVSGVALRLRRGMLYLQASFIIVKFAA